MPGILNQFKPLTRRFARSPMFTAVTVLTLAIGTGRWTLSGRSNA